MRKCGKNCKDGQATYDKKAHVYCMLDTYDYKYTNSLYNTHCFSTVTMVARTLYVNCLSCSNVALT